MELPPELTRIPLSALDVLRYMGRSGVTQGDALALAEGTGMSERGIGKAIRGLITKGYLTADDSYVYSLTDKGFQAIDDIADYDAAQGDGSGASASAGLVEQNLVIVSPDALGMRQSATLQVGLAEKSMLQEPSQLILRLSSVGGNVSPTEVTLNLAPGQAVGAATAQVVPDGRYNAVRVQVEAIQMVDEAEIHPAGGIFFDVPVGRGSGNLRAWYGSLSLRS